MTGSPPGKSLSTGAIQRLLGSVSSAVVRPASRSLGTASIHHGLEVTVHGRTRGNRGGRPSGARRPGAVLAGGVAGGHGRRADDWSAGASRCRASSTIGSRRTAKAPVILSYRGPMGSGKTDIFDMPRAVIDAEGVFLDASSAWYPLFRTDAGDLRSDAEPARRLDAWWGRAGHSPAAGVVCVIPPTRRRRTSTCWPVPTWSTQGASGAASAGRLPAAVRRGAGASTTCPSSVATRLLLDG